MIVDLEAAKARLLALDAEREPLLALIRAGEAYEMVIGKSLFEPSAERTRVQARRLKSLGAGRASPVMDLTVDAVSPLLEMLGPTTTGDLVTLLNERTELGLSVPNANNILSARLSNSEKFESRRSEGWWFKDRPWPADTAEKALKDDTLQGLDEDDDI